MANLDNFVRDNPVLHDVWVEMTEKGRIEGKAEGLRLAIERMLAARFGPLREDLQAALQAADLPLLELLTDHAALDTLEQVRQRLGLPAS